MRSTDAELKHYLQLADDEVARISAILKNADQIDENKRLHEVERRTNAASAA
jgi:hypothetical protein